MNVAARKKREKLHSTLPMDGWKRDFLLTDGKKDVLRDQVSPLGGTNKISWPKKSHYLALSTIKFYNNFAFLDTQPPFNVEGGKKSKQLKHVHINLCCSGLSEGNNLPWLLSGWGEPQTILDNVQMEQETRVEKKEWTVQYCNHCAINISRLVKNQTNQHFLM